MSPVGDPFSRLIVALEPWLNELVFIGGCAHALYRRHPDAQPLDYPPLGTLDADIAIPWHLPSPDQDIRSRLIAYGFAEEFLGSDRPPATHYHLGGEHSGFYAEFLTPLTGSGQSRTGERKATMNIAGVNSQQLRYIEILLAHPWVVDYQTGEVRASIQVPNPVSFIAQKILIHPKRIRDDRAKDILYVHDTFEVFGTRLQELEGVWRKLIRPELHPRKAAFIKRTLDQVFGSVTDDIRRAAQMSGPRALSPESLQQACHYGQQLVFT